MKSFNSVGVWSFEIYIYLISNELPFWVVSLKPNRREYQQIGNLSIATTQVSHRFNSQSDGYRDQENG
jgi:hypothetical protein